VAKEKARFLRLSMVDYLLPSEEYQKMEKCRYYKIDHHARPQSKEVSAHRQQQAISTVEIPYCEHSSGEFSLRLMVR